MAIAGAIAQVAALVVENKDAVKDIAVQGGKMVADHKKEVAGVAAGGVALFAADYHGRKAQQKKDAPRIIEAAEHGFDLGLRKGVKYTSDKARALYVYPPVAQIALACFIAQSDGKINKDEKLAIEAIGSQIHRLLIAPFLLHRSTLHCYSAPWQTAT